MKTMIITSLEDASLCGVSSCFVLASQVAITKCLGGGEQIEIFQNVGG